MPKAKKDKKDDEQPKRRLRNVRVHEVSLVDAPAVPDATFLIVKRDPAAQYPALKAALQGSNAVTAKYDVIKFDPGNGRDPIEIRMFLDFTDAQLEKFGSPMRPIIQAIRALRSNADSLPDLAMRAMAALIEAARQMSAAGGMGEGGQGMGEGGQGMGEGGQGMGEGGGMGEGSPFPMGDEEEDEDDEFGGFPFSRATTIEDILGKGAGVPRYMEYASWKKVAEALATISEVVQSAKKMIVAKAGHEDDEDDDEHPAPPLFGGRNKKPTHKATELGSLIQRLREEKGMSAADLGTAAGVTGGTMRSIEQGDIEVPPRTRLRQIAEALDVGVQQLIDAVPSGERDRINEDPPPNASKADDSIEGLGKAWREHVEAEEQAASDAEGHELRKQLEEVQAELAEQAEMRSEFKKELRELTGIVD